jgi:hypothetical protein
MKKTILFLAVAVVFISAVAVVFISCERKYSETITYYVNEPVYMSMEDFQKSVIVTEERPAISGGGKICFYNGYLYISETGTGIHIIDNTVPSNPHAIGFIKVLGNADLSIRDNLLYADAYSNLVWFDISNPAKPQIKGILENVFPEALPICDNGYGYDYDDVYSTESKKKGVIVGWNLTQKSMEVEENYSRGCYDYGVFAERGFFTNGLSAPKSNNGINGSMSRFSLYRDYLYTVINNQMTIFDLSNEVPSLCVEKLYMGWNIETIFSYKENLFFGTPTGLLIYSAADPLEPQYCSSISHAFGCDPVVVENDLAYVTIHSGNICGQNNNALFVVDVQDVYNPREIASYAMTCPKGLGIDNGTLFVCDNGLKIFKADDPQTIIANKLAHYPGMDGFDVIPFDNVLMMIADDGLYQYDYSNLGNIRQLGVLKFTRK